MKINEKGVGIHIKGKNFEYIKAVSKPNAKTKFTHEVWVKCAAKDIKNKVYVFEEEVK